MSLERHSMSEIIIYEQKKDAQFDKRRLLMEKWAMYCQQPASEGKVIELKASTMKMKHS
jgi:hypothetical protein